METKKMTVKIDLTNPDPDSAVSYADDLKGMTPNSPELMEFLDSLIEPLPDESGFRFNGGFSISNQGDSSTLAISLTNKQDDSNFTYCKEDIFFYNYKSLMFQQMFSIMLNKSLDKFKNFRKGRK